MKPVTKRLTALCLTLVLAAGLLTGCAGPQTEEPPQSGASSGQSAPESSAPAVQTVPEEQPQKETPELSTGSEEAVEKPEAKPGKKPEQKPESRPAKKPEQPAPAPQPQAPAEKPAPKPEVEAPAPKPRPEPPAPAPEKPQPPAEKPQDGQITVTMSIRCDDILNHMEDLTPGKDALVPKNGVIYSGSGLKVKEGSTVSDLLKRVTRREKIHMEAVNDPVYQSVYVKGIGNLYEFDCGKFSGWMYRVNGKIPNYGCSKYVLKDGDVVEWFYTCDGSKLAS